MTTREMIEVAVLGAVIRDRLSGPMGTSPPSHYLDAPGATARQIQEAVKEVRTDPRWQKEIADAAAKIDAEAAVWEPNGR